MNIKSRILEFIPEKCMLELDAVCRDVLIPDNNTKVDMMNNILNKYNVNYQELGPGTNRYAIFIDGYVFKIAMDKAGKRDNLAEFSMSQELQPFVIKAYECNGLFVVTEYVTVISKEEFLNSKDQIRETLAYLAEGYLLGDVGSITKNYTNWGYRDDGSLVILDFAYIYRVLGNEMFCTATDKNGTVCTTMLEYDENFNNLICPKCRRKYTFHEIRRKIDKEYETKELNAIKQIAFKVTKPNQDISMIQNTDEVNEPELNENGGNETMGKKHKNMVYSDNNHVDEEELEMSYLDAIEFMRNVNNMNHECNCTCDCNCETEQKTLSQAHINYNKNKELIELVCDDKDKDELIRMIQAEDDDVFNTEDSQKLFDVVNEDDPLADAVDDVDEFLDKDHGEETDDEFVSDPEELDEYDEEGEDDDPEEELSCPPVTNELGAGVTFIDVDEPVHEEQSDTVNNENNDTIIILTDSDKEDALRKYLMADNESSDDYDDSYDDLHDEAIKDSKIPKKKFDNR